MRTLLVIVVAGALLIGVLVLGIQVWTGLGDVQMPWQGWLALVLGVVFTLALGVGLMGLVFYSARHGHDEAHPAEAPEQQASYNPHPHQGRHSRDNDRR